MCAIVDANVQHQVFGDNPTEAGKFFFDWLTKPKGGILVVGGTKLQRELGNNLNFIRVLNERLLAGRAMRISNRIVDDEESKLRAQDVCRSDDEHVLALARVSGARLLFTNDRDLQRDFKNSSIVSGTNGRIYTTGKSRKVNSTHRTLLSRNDLCNG